MKILNETIEAENEAFKLRNQTGKLLARVEEESGNREQRAAPLAIAAAVAGTGLFGPGIAMSSGGCGGITGIFGSCQRTSLNAENISRLANSFNSLATVYWKSAPKQMRIFFCCWRTCKTLKSSNWNARKPEQKLETSWGTIRNCRPQFEWNNNLSENPNNTTTIKLQHWHSSIITFYTLCRHKRLSSSLIFFSNYCYKCYSYLINAFQSL